jgi:hypothetical protein
MTDYRDGRWHGWNGGECPVNPDDEVRGMEWQSTNWQTLARNCDWTSFLGAFRVVKRDPRVWWINEYPDGMLGCHSSKEIADRVATPDRSRCFKVQEVEE